jgi:CheY-like chemotaxis protein
LLNNAVKFTPEDGAVSIAVKRSGAGADGAEVASARAEIIVRDTGIGISPDFLPHLFKRFRQSDGTTSRSHGGLGLGLSIARSLVELHGGEVHGHSDGLGTGAIFTIRLPLAPPLQTFSGRSIASPPSIEQPAATLNCADILVVDDEPDIRLMVQRVLERHGASVRVAGSAAEALDAIAQRWPDALISDIGMPGKDGYWLIRQIRAKESRRPAPTPATSSPDKKSSRNLPAIALTAYARDEDRGRAIASGYHAHVSKPLNAGELVSTIHQLCNSTETAAVTLS